MGFSLVYVDIVLGCLNDINFFTALQKSWHIIDNTREKFSVWTWHPDEPWVIRWPLVLNALPLKGPRGRQHGFIIGVESVKGNYRTASFVQWSHVCGPSRPERGNAGRLVLRAWNPQSHTRQNEILDVWSLDLSPQYSLWKQLALTLVYLLVLGIVGKFQLD